MIKLAAIVPHSPILIPNIGKENQTQLESTIKAYQKLASDIREKEIESIILISSHGPIRPGIFSIGLNERFNINFEEFGDFSTKFELLCDLELSQIIREGFINDEKVQMISRSGLDHGASIPLYLLCYGLKEIKVVLIYVSGSGLAKHYHFGEQIIKKIPKSFKKNIAIIASGDLAHCLTKKAPVKYSPKGAKFDQKIIEAIKKDFHEEISGLNQELLKEVKACGTRSISVLMGALSGLEYEAKVLSYEYPFGIGNLTAEFILKAPTLGRSS